MKFSHKKKENNDGFGKYFFHFLSIILGLAYGIFERGAILKTWWLEVIIADIIILIMHMTFRSWLFVGCIQEIKDINVKPSVQSSCIFIGIVMAGFIYVPAILVIIVKWLFGLG